MGLYFGTDGFRGKTNEDLTWDIAYKIGNALSTLKEKPKVIIGSDTRISNSYFTVAVALGAMSGGADVIDIGVVPTAGIAYITKELKADYGVVISASHNSEEYNGIKVFNGEGYKLGDIEEERIERCFIHSKTNDYPNIGTFKQNFSFDKIYKKFLLKSSKHTFEGKTIVLDCAYGASHKLAPEIFRKLGANVIASNSTNDGRKINKNCGALYPENLINKITRYKADIGFAFDGDADRLICVDEKGRVINGDMIIFGLAKYYKRLGILKGNTAVGTSHTNMAIENKLKENGIDLIRTDIGDKYVLQKLLEKDLSIGGEQSGHIIIKDLHTTGDGILTAIILMNALIDENKNISEFINVDLFPQTNLNVVVKDKFRVMNNEELMHKLAEYNAELEGKGRIMLRASGTEPKIRIMVESKDSELNDTIANELAIIVKNIDE